MKKTPYCYSVLGYCHDPAVGEMLNIGVVLYAPGNGFFRAKIDPHYTRLSNTFVGFDGYAPDGQPRRPRVVRELDAQLDRHWPR